MSTELPEIGQFSTIATNNQIFGERIKDLIGRASRRAITPRSALLAEIRKSAAIGGSRQYGSLRET